MFSKVSKKMGKHKGVALHQAATDGDIEEAKRILKKFPISVNKRLEGSLLTSLMLAIKNGHVDMARFLVEGGAKKQEDKDSEGATSLVRL